VITTVLTAIAHATPAYVLAPFLPIALTARSARPTPR
jgi:hypothetical protein